MISPLKPYILRPFREKLRLERNQSRRNKTPASIAAAKQSEAVRWSLHVYVYKRASRQEGCDLHAEACNHDHCCCVVAPHFYWEQQQGPLVLKDEKKKNSVLDRLEILERLIAVVRYLLYCLFG